MEKGTFRFGRKKRKENGSGVVNLAELARRKRQEEVADLALSPLLMRCAVCLFRSGNSGSNAQL